MTAFILAAVLAAGPVTLHLEWGGDLVSTAQDVVVTPQDAAGSVVGTPAATESSLAICRCNGDPSKPECSCRGSCACQSIAKPALTIISPASWDCAYCPGFRAQDWSAFNATEERRDGLRAYPCAEWIDKRGVIRRLFGAYTPDQVLWSYRRTME